MRFRLLSGWALFISASAVAHVNLNSDPSVKLFSAVLKQSGESSNVVFSPYAIRHALGMAALGARGNTQKQLGRIPDSLPEKRSSTYKLSVASRLWVQMGFPLLESFMELSEKNFGHRPWMVDFTQAPDYLANRVNDWVEERTFGKIRKFLSDDSIDPSTKMLLTSAMHFKGSWVKPLSLSDPKTQMMQVTGSFNYFQNKDLQVVELPYVDGDVSMVLVLPAVASGLGELENSLSIENLGKWTNQANSREVRVVIPKFELDSTLELAQILKTIGVEDPFSPENADFSGMMGVKKLHLGRVSHKTLITVTETGTEAESDSHSISPPEAAGRKLASAPALFEANRPFLFGIKHQSSNTYLLMGRVVQPVAPEGE